MKIIILRTNTANFGKVGTYNVQEVGLAQALIKKGHDVKVLFLHKKVKEIEKDSIYDFVYYLPHKSIGLHGIFNVNILSKFNPEQIIMWTDNQLWTKNVIKWAQKRNIPCICYFGNVLSNKPFWLNQLYTKLILKRNIASYHYSTNFAKTLEVKNQMIECKVPVDRVVNIGLDEELLVNKYSTDYNIRSEIGYKKEDKIILFVGRLYEYKKPITACKILIELLKRDKSYKLILIGTGPLKDKLIEFIKENEIEEYAKYLGEVNYNSIYKYMVASDCVINLCPVEIFGMTILEAMYYNLPVVAQLAPGPKEIIDNNLNGFIYDYREDPIKWANVIEEAIIRKKEIGLNAHKKVLEKFVWSKIAEEFLNFRK